jgi:cbb3-type cytochrome oxidase subunit 3
MNQNQKFALLIFTIVVLAVVVFVYVTVRGNIAAM